ncbi:MAG: SufE family protein [Aquisalimonadaceae bacterium]
MDSHLPIDRKQRELVEEFLRLDDWTVRYEHLMRLGERLPPFPEAWRQAGNRVHGCASLLWLRGLGEPGCLIYRGASDCPMDAGLLAMALSVYSGQPAADIVASPPRFIFALGLPSRLSMNRLQGLERLVERIRRFALQRLMQTHVPVTLNRGREQRLAR